MDFEEVTKTAFHIRSIGWLIWGYFHFPDEKLPLTSSPRGYSPLKFGGIHSEPKISAQPFTCGDWWVYMHASPGLIGKPKFLQTGLKSQFCWCFCPYTLKLSNTISINTHSMQCHTQDPHSQLHSLLLVFCFPPLPHGHTYSWASNCLCWKGFVFCLCFSLAIAVTQGWTKPLQGCPCLYCHTNLNHSTCAAFAAKCIHSSSQTQPMEAVFSCLDSKHNPQPRTNPWTHVLISDIGSVAHNGLADIRYSMYKNTLNTLNCFKSCTLS